LRGIDPQADHIAVRPCYEPFSGSGTTIIAAEIAGRVCLAMEVSPEYCDVAIERWQAMTGGVTVLPGNGSSFADTASRRPKEARENICMLRK
jgi:hypothetical protein